MVSEIANLLLIIHLWVRFCLVSAFGTRIGVIGYLVALVLRPLLDRRILLCRFVIGLATLLRSGRRNFVRLRRLGGLRVVGGLLDRRLLARRLLWRSSLVSGRRRLLLGIFCRRSHLRLLDGLLDRLVVLDQAVGVDLLLDRLLLDELLRRGLHAGLLLGRDQIVGIGHLIGEVVGIDHDVLGQVIVDRQAVLADRLLAGSALVGLGKGIGLGVLGVLAELVSGGLVRPELLDLRL